MNTPFPAYEIAERGGLHKGLLRRYRHDPDHLIEKAIRSYEARIAEHRAWIADTYLHVAPDTATEAIVRYQTKKWPSDIRRLLAEAEVLRGILHERRNPQA